MAVDSLGMLDALARLAGAAGGGARGRGAHRRVGAPARRRLRQHRRAGHGRVGDRRRRPRERSAPPRSPCRSSCSSSTAPRRSSGRARSRSPCRTRATPRRRWRWPRARSAAGATLVVLVVRRRARHVSRTSAGALHLPCPTGIAMPRAALGAMVAPLFVTLFRMGLLPEAHAGLVKAQQQLARRRDQCRPEVEGAANPARELARRIGRTIPLVYGGGGLGAVAAMRWKCERQREREGTRVLEPVPGARPQRDLRVGPARRRDPPGR